MRTLIAALFPPADPVVAIHDSTEEAEAAVHFLGRAGYPSRMLGVVARPSAVAGRAGASMASPRRRWETSGVLWGLMWVGVALGATALASANAIAPGVLLMGGAMLLALQAAVVCSSVAPERVTQATWRTAAPSGTPYAGDLACDRLLLVVSGSRSEIALARSLLRMRAPGPARA